MMDDVDDMDDGEPFDRPLRLVLTPGLSAPGSFIARLSLLRASKPSRVITSYETTTERASQLRLPRSLTYKSQVTKRVREEKCLGAWVLGCLGAWPCLFAALHYFIKSVGISRHRCPTTPVDHRPLFSPIRSTIHHHTKNHHHHHNSLSSLIPDP